LALAMLVACIGVVASVSRIGFELEEDLGLGWLFQLRGARPAPADAVIVRFDRDTFSRLHDLPAEIDAWPEPLRGCARAEPGMAGLPAAGKLDRLPRAFLTCLVRELDRRGAAAIVFDFSLRRDLSREEGMAGLAAAIREHGRVVLLVDATRRTGLSGSNGAGATRGGLHFDLLEKPHAALTATAAAIAPFPLPPINDRVYQFWAFNPALPIPIQLPVRALEVLAAEALDRFTRALGQPAAVGATPAEALRHGTELFRAEAHRLGSGPALAAGLTRREVEQLAALARVYRGPDGYYLNLYGPPGSFPSVSAADLLLTDPGWTLDPSFTDLTGKVAFVGEAELYERQRSDGFGTPFSRDDVDMSGVEVGATAFANLLHGETIVALPEWARTGLVGLLGAALTLASCSGRVWRGLGLTLALALAYAAAAIVGFAHAGLWLPVVVPLLLLLPLSIGVGELAHYLGAARWLTIYTPRQVGRRLLAGHELVTGAVQRREVTVMLTDVAGFTSLAERSAPEAMREFVNRHFTMLEACVEAESGTVPQFIGDSMLAFWGAPDPQPDHAARACRAALRIKAALEEENRERAARGEPPVCIRIGINTGQVTAGNVGAPSRSSYGIVGDTVNTTQRIEQLAKLVCPDRPAAAAAVLVSAATRDQAGDAAFLFTDAGLHPVRGRQEAVRIFRLEGARVPIPAPANVIRLPRPESADGAPDRRRRRRAGGGRA
jgi:adenylate cyclase